MRLATRDIDVAVARSLAQREKSLNQLLTDADFRCEFRSRGIPPVTLYVARRGDEEIEIEFITNARGPSEGVRYVQSGLTAQELRYVDLLLANKWFLPLDSLSDGELDGRVWVPTQRAFVLHKGLVQEDGRTLEEGEGPLLHVLCARWLRRLARMVALGHARRSPGLYRLGLDDAAGTFSPPSQRRPRLESTLF